MTNRDRVYVALCIVLASFATTLHAQPATQPVQTGKSVGGPILGPVVGVGRGTPLTPAQEAEEKQNQIKQLIQQFVADDESLSVLAAAQLAQMGKEATPLLEQAAADKTLAPPVKQRFDLLLATIKSDTAARASFDNYLKGKNIAGGNIGPVVDETLRQAFPKHVFYVLRFRQFPVAREVPPGMSASNIFVVNPDNSVKSLLDTQAAKNFFQAAYPPAKSDDTLKLAARAWLRISQEWRQDGFYQFTIPADAVAVDNSDEKNPRVTAKAVVAGGGNAGRISVTLTFDAAGKLTSAAEEAALREGVRPLCQATKLLDPDPIVQGMARQSIRVMGSNAREYLIEQRAKAAPKLQAAIDEIWQQIQADGR